MVCFVEDGHLVVVVECLVEDGHLVVVECGFVGCLEWERDDPEQGDVVEGVLHEDEVVEVLQ